MKWVALAILIVIVPYTFLTLYFRKPGPAYQPYQSMKDRANTARLLSAGYQRITLDAQRPADSTSIGVATSTTTSSGGLPNDLRSTLVEPPLLPAEILSVAAAGTISAQRAYPIQFTCATPNNKQQLAGAELYLKDNEVVITPDFELVTGTLLTRTRENVILLTVPAGAFKPGRYRVILAGQNSSRTWTLQVQ